MAFELPPLPFDKTALDPHMSAETFDYHWGKHHKAYVDKTNGWIDEKGLAGLSLLQVIDKAKTGGDKGLFNNSAQIWNHSFFWQCLAPAGSTKPSGKLAALIESGFGSQEALLKKFADEAVGHFASGWAWLVLEGDALKVTSYHDADTPVAHGAVPLFTLDVWEHAYYVDYRNARPKFAETVLANIVNWDFIAQNLDGAGASRADQQQ
ncbi:superoxide dismutase [Sphingomonas nostoxanthinifaciens]|uniref:superoxide dismutase n=1 Tax=Sphingomonas nostoxanthinifaciens TaxID=2872652 RepID=UPI001CC20976|nr:superoxide dismutase [Sphingomonas nostoxanthinifaciens]UAK25316.1 superoxide dismutase [Sphingomonas nostoxanthinifaciens]